MPPFWPSDDGRHPVTAPHARPRVDVGGRGASSCLVSGAARAGSRSLWRRSGATGRAPVCPVEGMNRSMIHLGEWVSPHGLTTRRMAERVRGTVAAQAARLTGVSASHLA
jgi:hypothetical protein